MTQLINEEVNVHSFYFRTGDEFKSFPRQIEWEGRFVTFAETGLRYLVKRGSGLVQLFDMTAGDTTYRLRSDGSHWTLVGTRGGN
jgi:hypothetical protein